MAVIPARTMDEKATLLAYLASKIGSSPQEMIGEMPYVIVGVTRGTKTQGVVMYLNFRGPTIEMACAGEPGWLTPGNLRDLFAYPFKQLNCWTITTVVGRRNTKAREFNKQLGFIELGVVETSPNKDDDSIIYKMTRPQCRWLGNVIDMPARRAAGGANGR